MSCCFFLVGGVDQITCNTSSSPISHPLAGDSLGLSSDPFYFSIAASLGDGFLPPRLLAYRKEALAKVYDGFSRSRAVASERIASSQEKPHRSAEGTGEVSHGVEFKGGRCNTSNYYRGPVWTRRPRREAIQSEEEASKEEAVICRNALTVATEASSQQHAEVLLFLSKCVSSGRGSKGDKGFAGILLKERERGHVASGDPDGTRDGSAAGCPSKMADFAARKSGSVVEHERATCEGGEKSLDDDEASRTHRDSPSSDPGQTAAEHSGAEGATGHLGPPGNGSDSAQVVLVEGKETEGVHGLCSSGEDNGTEVMLTVDTNASVSRQRAVGVSLPVFVNELHFLHAGPGV